MPEFYYQARNSLGAAISGDLEAVSEDDLIKKLQAMNCMPVRVNLKKSGSATADPGPTLIKRVRSREIVMLNMKLAYMTDAGIPLLKCIRLLAGQFENAALKTVLLNISKKVSEGVSLSDSFAMHPGVFSKMYISMVRVGEISGTLHIVLNRLAVYTEQEEALKQKIKGALFYPMILLTAGFLVTVLIVTFVIPQFVTIFTRANVELPLPTLILYHLGSFLKNFWVILVLIAAATGYGIKKFLGTSVGSDYFDRFVLKLPHVGQLIKLVCVTRFCRALGILLESDVAVLKSLDVLKSVVGNSVYERIIARISQSVEKGEKISSQLAGSEYFPGDVVSMIATGEETGKLAPMLYKVAGYYEAVVDDSVKKLTMLIEPVFVVFMGLLAGLIMSSMLLPMFDMVKTIQK